MANPASNETKKSGNVQKALTSHSSQTQRWQASNTQSHTRTREHLHGDRFGTTSSMGLGGTPTIYQDWSYTDKLHLTMRHSKSHSPQHCRTMTPSKNLGTRHMDKRTNGQIWDMTDTRSLLLPTLFSPSSLSQGSTIPSPSHSIHILIWKENSQVDEVLTEG